MTDTSNKLLDSSASWKSCGRPCRAAKSVPSLNSSVPPPVEDRCTAVNLPFQNPHYSPMHPSGFGQMVSVQSSACHASCRCPGTLQARVRQHTSMNHSRICRTRHGVISKPAVLTNSSRLQHHAAPPRPTTMQPAASTRHGELLGICFIPDVWCDQYRNKVREVDGKQEDQAPTWLVRSGVGKDELVCEVEHGGRCFSGGLADVMHDGGGGGGGLGQVIDRDCLRDEPMRQRREGSCNFSGG